MVVTKGLLAVSFILSSFLGAQISFASLNAQYFVPVAKDLLPFSTFPVSAQPRMQEGKIKYTLPASLLGQETIIELERQGDGTWADDHAEGRCVVIETRGACLVKYKGLRIDMNNVRIALAGLDQRDFDGHLGVARTFEGEPLGILYFEIEAEGELEATVDYQVPR